MPVHSARPFPVHGGTVGDDVHLDAGSCAWYIVEIVHAHASKLREEKDIARGPTLAEIERAGGYAPLSLMDQLAGGTGSGDAFFRAQSVSSRRLAETISHARDPKERGKVLLVDHYNARPFPIRPGAVSDGTGVAAGSVPWYMAEIAYERFVSIAELRGKRGFPSLRAVDRSGGFQPHEFLDLMAGGDGSGRALYAMRSRAAQVIRKQLAGMSLAVEIEETKK